MSMTDEPCPVCGAGYLTPQVGMCRVVLNGKEYELPSYFAVCHNCGSEVADADDINQNAELMRDLRRRVETSLEYDALVGRPGEENEQ